MLDNGVNRSLARDVDISTMMSMRDQGMSNPQIAERLGVTYKTVLKYIGKQPRGMPRNYRVNNFDPVINPTDAPARAQDYKTVEKPVLRVVSTVSTLEGDTNKYVIDTSSGSVEISGLVNGLLDRQTLDSFLRELKEIRSIFNNVGVE